MAKKQKGDSSPARILIADDDRVTCMMFQGHLKNAGYDVVIAEDGAEAVEKMTEDISLAILDLNMPNLSGVECLQQLRNKFPNSEFLIVSGVGQIRDAVQAMKDGAYEFITKPCEPEEFISHVKRALRTAELSRKNKQLRQIVEQPRSSGALVGETPLARTLMERINKLANLDSTVLLTGESGTGKTTIARMIHDQGPRSQAPFVAVNCASLPRELIEAELFGHVKGAFTGATLDRPGRAEIAAGGTLFLDEIGDLPLDLQPKLLTFLQEKTIQRIGSNKSIEVDVRLIAATHQDLLEMCGDRRFRSDLYYRLNVLQVEAPSLRNRRNDIPLLAQTIIDRIVRRRGGHKITLENDAIETLKLHDWPGNIRELENVLERASAFCESDRITAVDLELVPARMNDLISSDAAESWMSGLTLKEIEKRVLIETLQANDGNKAMAARQLGISEKSIYNKLRRFDLFKTARVS